MGFEPEVMAPRGEAEGRGRPVITTENVLPPPPWERNKEPLRNSLTGLLAFILHHKTGLRGRDDDDEPEEERKRYDQ
ncbi:hypothetical protein EYF80_005241 [Liparis tanakae]|uniref:Uncharacterized protein n=1 Tax=Liparis tanakae TaxID=230148 RepID=A0A4Z2J3M7_9TELE|nr:hypothetical protein EYF80_005241 [Liparis tanakae]